MSTNVKTKPPVWFWIVSVLALLWNLMGVGAYLADAYMKDEMMAAFTEAQKSIFENQPAWVTGAYAIAVFAGALGCIALLLRKKWAKPLFWLSIIAVISRTIYYFFRTNATEVFDMFQGTIMPILVIVIAGLLLIITKIASERNWIS
ncbi:hypothetical protein FEE95_12930 [Maribacter algarum]|uniref:Sugar transporter n=1 Tax=Maribacter algarum (ex Zhang et al. 2020) TaxID=2578118 RepID=A0A5S3PTY3_9FLAO|nr:hypothetical protein [Maribacter algarum]TMM57383.1 hypothetical protein FEE95_12930 [Maribacter algarum]